jgi:NADH-quinone oxidoreductase subunit A
MIWTLALYFLLVLALVATMLGVSYLLGGRHTAPAKGSPYEGGIVSEGSARLRLSVKFYLVAMFFVIFDVEAAFLFSWAVAARHTGWLGFWEALIFAVILMLTLLYLVKVGALDWSRFKRPREVSR